jgi:hypothetical protein
MNRDELVGYIQGLIDMSKESSEGIPETKLLNLINKALEKHRLNQIKGGGAFFYNAEHYENLCQSHKDNNDQSNPKNGPNISNHGVIGEKI